VQVSRNIFDIAGLSTFVKKNLWGRVSALLLSITSVTTLIGKLCFMQRTGGERPDMWVLASGAKEARFLIKAELSHNAREFVWFIISSIVTACPAAFFVYRNLSAREKETEQAVEGIHSKKYNQNQTPSFFFLIFAGMTSLYMMNAWMPICKFLWPRVHLFSAWYWDLRWT